MILSSHATTAKYSERHLRPRELAAAIKCMRCKSERGRPAGGALAGCSRPLLSCPSLLHPRACRAEKQIGTKAKANKGDGNGETRRKRGGNAGLGARRSLWICQCGIKIGAGEIDARC